MVQNESTDGQIAVLVNKVVRSMRQLALLSGRYSPAVATKRAGELRSRVEALIVEIEASGHFASPEIAASVRRDYIAERSRYVAAGARRFFAFPLNWMIRDGEVAMEAAVSVAKGTAKARKRVARSSGQSRRESQLQ